MRTNRYFYPIGIFVIALIIKFVGWEYSTKPLQFDGIEYHILGVNLVQKHYYSFEPIVEGPTYYREPGYPLILASIYAVWDFCGGELTKVIHRQPENYRCIIATPEMRFAMSIQIILSSLACVFLYLTLRFAFNEKYSAATTLFYIIFSLGSVYPADYQLLRESTQTSFSIIASYYFAKYIFSDNLKSFIIFSLITAYLALMLKVAIIIPFFVFLFILLRKKSIMKALRMSVLNGILIILFSLPWLIRTYSFYPDPRILISWGTTLTSEKMTYGKVSLDLQNLGERNNPDIGTDFELSSAPAKESFDNSYKNGYYKMKTERVRQAILKKDKYYFYKKPFIMMVKNFRMFVYKPFIDIKHDYTIFTKIKNLFFQIIGVIMGMVFFFGVYKGAFKYYYLFIGGLPYLVFYLLYSTHSPRHYLPCYPFFVFSVVIGCIFLYKIMTKVFSTVKSKNQ